MALGRQRDRQAEMLVAWSEMPRSPGHVFYDLESVQRVGVTLPPPMTGVGRASTALAARGSPRPAMRACKIVGGE